MTYDFVPAGAKVIGVGELTRGIKGLLEGAYPSIWVSGEVSNLARPSSGHMYLSLKDAEASLRAVIYRGVALRLRFEPHDGLEVVARGRLSVYSPRGEYQLLIEEMHPKGIGAQELALRQLREKLFRLGYFAPERKKALPRFPNRLALLTSPTGAAVRDMLEVLARRWPRVEVYVCPTRVQGEGAAQEISAGLRLLNRLHAGRRLLVDAIIIGRGGGSTEDLWAFNEECVARAIFESKIPVVSAVGHEIDVTVADLVADVRALTPSQAAATVVPDRFEWFQGLQDLEERLRTALRQQMEQRRHRLDDLASRRAFRLPLEQVRDQEQRLDDWAERLRRAIRRRVQLASDRLAAGAAQLETLSPLNVLRRGYTLTQQEKDQSLVRGVNQVQPGDLLRTLVPGGWILSRVEVAQEADPVAPPTQGWPPAARTQS